MNQNYYQILEINQNASNQEIQDAFKKQSNRYHPDTNKDDPLAKEKFQQVLKAYEVLSNDVKKEVYDETLKSFTSNQNQPQIENSIPQFDQQNNTTQPNQPINEFPNNQELNLPTLSNQKEHSKLGRAGAILNIIGSTIFILFTFWFIIPLFFLIPSIISNSNYLKGKDNKISAGVWGLIFGSFIGGIFILVSD